MKKKSISKSYLRLLKIALPYSKRLAAGVLCGMLFAGSMASLLPLLKNLLSGMSEMGELSLEQMLALIILLPIVATLRGVGFFASKYLVEWVGMRVIMDIRDRLFDHITSQPLIFFAKSRAGDLITRLTSDTQMIRELVSTVLGNLVREPFVLLFVLGYIIWLDWKLTLITLVGFPLCAIPILVLGRKVRAAALSGQENMAGLLSVAQEAIAGAQVVKAFGMEEAEKERFGGFNARFFRRSMRVVKARAMNDPIIVSFASVGFAIIIFYAYDTNMQVDALVTFLMALVMMYKPIRNLTKIHLRIQRSFAGAERIFEILDTKMSLPEKSSATPLKDEIERVSFENVGFAYDNNAVLSEINLDAERGQCLALVGSSGAGKTTLVNLIPRFYDVSSGKITINNRDIRDYTVSSLRKKIAIVTQRTILFNRSVAENIAYGKPDATQAEIESVARRANAHSFIAEMEDGYDTLIQEQGARLSGGQAQRLAIARALLKNAPILILDEATSALDTESERLVQSALNELMAGRTVFVIAHRLSTISHADKIVVLDKGRIVEYGTHEQLLDADTKYRMLYRMQFENK